MSRPIVNLSIEFGPVTAFFIGYGIFGFFPAVAVSMIATTLAVGIAYLIDRRVAFFPLLGLAILLIFGSLSIERHDAEVFIVKDTIIDLIFALALLGSVYIGKPALQIFFDATFGLSDYGWRVLTIRWGIFYLVLSIMNEVVRRMYDEHLWVQYKFATVILVIVFGVYQFTLAARTRIQGATNAWGLRVAPIHLSSTSHAPHE